MKRITTYAEFQALKAIYKSAKIVSVSEMAHLFLLESRKENIEILHRKSKKG